MNESSEAEITFMDRQRPTWLHSNFAVGQKVEQSTEYGFIKFGSRVDVLLPVGAKLNVKLDQMVQGGVTVLATF